MVTRAETKYVRISPYRVRTVIEVIKNKPVMQAMQLLRAINKKASFYLAKTINSALANAERKGYQERELFISKILANRGPMFKRYRAASFGRATSIRKRTTHIIVELDILDNRRLS
ncbi:MAG: 50S ribosomal protein L22 [Candidatus Omnitrophica bacterium]|nr:50S ribosomal protein L22 [Candidatus Omnitrophota bacterium]